VGVWSVPAERPDEGRGEDNVADQTQANEENPHLGFDSGLVNQHHRDVILDGIDAMTLLALEAGAVIHQLHWRLTVGAGQDFQEFGIDGHGVSELWNYSILR
jgi:hypothetical protein